MKHRFLLAKSHNLVERTDRNQLLLNTGRKTPFRCEESERRRSQSGKGGNGPSGERTNPGVSKNLVFGDMDEV